jgi:hypothetical protein
MKRLNKRSPCFDKLQKHIDHEFKKLREEHIDKWSFYKDFGIKDRYPNGKEINIYGGKWEGSRPQTFWDTNYIPAYIDLVFNSCMDLISQTIKEYNIHPNTCYEECERLLLIKIQETYKLMAIIDSRLKGDGHKIPSPIDTTSYVAEVQDKLKGRLLNYKLGNCDSIVWKCIHSPLLNWFVDKIVNFFKFS